MAFSLPNFWFVKSNAFDIFSSLPFHYIMSFIELKFICFDRMLYLLSYTPIYIPNEFGPHLERTFLGGQVLTTTISYIRHFILLLNIIQVYGGTYRI